MKPLFAALIGYALAREAVDFRNRRRSVRRGTAAFPDVRLDARGIPTHACPACGEGLFRMFGRFADFELSFYLLDGECAACGVLVTLPTLIDAPEWSS